MVELADRFGEYSQITTTKSNSILRHITANPENKIMTQSPCETLKGRVRLPYPPRDSTCWLSSMISASEPPFLARLGFFLMVVVTLCGVGMFFGTVGDVLWGPEIRMASVFSHSTCYAASITREKIFHAISLCSTVGKHNTLHKNSNM